MIRLSHSYAASPAALWEVCTSWAALHEVCRPLVTFDGVPHEGHLGEGDIIETDVRLFGRLPPQPYRMEVLEADPAAMTFLSAEVGMGVRHWCHRARVVAVGTGSRLDEEIDIDAGWRTPAFNAWAKILYRARHKPRQRLLGEVTKR
ncbi:SRPBCC family protein [Pseudoroseicyclus sp. H15]